MDLSGLEVQGRYIKVLTEQVIALSSVSSSHPQKMDIWRTENHFDYPTGKLQLNTTHFPVTQ